MKKKSFICIAIMALLATGIILTGCGGSSSSTPPASTSYSFDSAAPKFLVAGSDDCDSVTVFSVAATTGALTEVPTSPFTATKANCPVVSVHPNGKWIYVTDEEGSSIQALSIDSTGTLTQIGSVVNNTGSAFSVAFSSDGKYLFTADMDAFVSAFGIDPTTGALTPMGYGGVANTSGWPPLIVSIASAGSYLYAGGVIPDAWQEYYSASIYGFTVGSSGTPASITGSPWAVPTNGESRSGAVVTDLSGKFLYAFTGSNLYGYSVSPSGSLTELAGFPIAPPNYSGNNNMPTISMVFEPRNKFLYFTDWGNGVRGYSFNSTTGALTELTGSPFAATGNSNCGLAADPSGTFLYSGDDNTNSVTGFTINQTTGVLTQMTTGPYQASQSWDLVSMGITH